jgi:hypothetical protein
MERSTVSGGTTLALVRDAFIARRERSTWREKKGQTANKQIKICGTIDPTTPEMKPWQ